jgi:hypothetical protein
LDLPLIALIGVTGRRRNIPTGTNNDTIRAKLERLHSARLICRDPEATYSRHVKASK